jgi:hypothetical protein
LREAAKFLDFSRPIGLMMIAVMHFIADEEDPHGIVGRLVSAPEPRPDESETATDCAVARIP